MGGRQLLFRLGVLFGVAPVPVQIGLRQFGEEAAGFIGLDFAVTARSRGVAQAQALLGARDSDIQQPALFLDPALFDR